MTKLTAKQAAELTNCAYSTVTLAIRGGKLRAKKVGNQYLIAPTDLEAWQATRRMGKPPIGEISYAQAGVMLGVTRETVRRCYVLRGYLPRAMTAEAVVEFALRRGWRWTFNDGECLHGVNYNPDRDRYACGHVGIETNNPLEFVYFQSISELIDEMKSVAPLSEWRVVK